ncbi:MAG: DUF4411 family protein [Planctomycetes bacterium]|nr:DUF4411 family protein [Planctomycetota bacterium]
MVKEDRLIAPHEVLKEIEKKDDVLLQWARKHKRMFKGLDQKQLQTVMDILHKFPRLVDPGKVIPDADPFVVALAKEMNRQGSLFGKCIVVTQEKLSSGKPKIPNVCQHYGIEYTPVIDVLKKEKWKF